MKPREARRKVLIKARMRRDNGWSDVCIRDISSRGLMLQAASAPARGSVVEVTRGRHMIIARVVWTNGQRFGVNTQERLNVDAIIAEPDLTSINYHKRLATDPTFDRRARIRPSVSHADAAERNRWWGQKVDFASICLFAICLVVALYSVAETVLRAPLSQVAAAMRKP